MGVGLGAWSLGAPRALLARRTSASSTGAERGVWSQGAPRALLARRTSASSMGVESDAWSLGAPRALKVRRTSASSMGVESDAWNLGAPRALEVRRTSARRMGVGLGVRPVLLGSMRGAEAKSTMGTVPRASSGCSPRTREAWSSMNTPRKSVYVTLSTLGGRGSSMTNPCIRVGATAPTGDGLTTVDS